MYKRLGALNISQATATVKHKPRMLTGRLEKIPSQRTLQLDIFSTQNAHCLRIKLDNNNAFGQWKSPCKVAVSNSHGAIIKNRRRVHSRVRHPANRPS